MKPIHDFSASSLWEVAKETESLHKLIPFITGLPASERGDKLLRIVQDELTTLICDPSALALRQNISQLSDDNEKLRERLDSLTIYNSHLILLLEDNGIVIPEQES